MATAICIRCGEPKTKPWDSCKACGLDPTNDETDLVKSVYLSIGRIEPGEDPDEYSSELDRVSTEIRSGRSPDYDQSELDRLRQQKNAVDAVPVSAAWSALVRFFMPGCFFLFALFVILLILKAL